MAVPNTNRQTLTRFGLGFCLLLLVFAHVFTQVAWAFVGVPKLEARVTDFTNTLSNAQVQALEAKLAAFEQKKGSQIAVLIIPTTQPEDIAEFSIKVFDLNLLGRKKIDDGALLIIAKDDRKFRIETGYGLEGVIPDAIAKRITSEIIKPFFQRNDYAGGINAGVDQMIALIDGEQLPEPSQTQYLEFNGEGLIFALFGGLFAGSIFSSLFGRVLGGLLAGAASSLIASLFLGFGFPAIIIGLIVFFLTSARFPGGGGWSNGGGYYGGGGGYYGGGSWGGGSSGSWSGGGGSGGGGGASDSW